MPNRKTHRLTIYTVFALLYVISAAFAMSYFFQNSALGDAYYRTRFDAMVDGSAARPFVFRHLVPMVTNAVEAISPTALRESATRWIEYVKADEDYKEARRYLPWLDKSFPSTASHYRRLVASVIIFGFLIGYMVSIYALGSILFPRTKAVALCAPVLAALAFGSFGYQWQYIYDIPCLCLSSACFYFIYRQRFRLYMLVFFLACLNKETAIFSLAFFTIWFFGRLGERRFAVLWAVQCAIYISVKIALNINYMDNSGFMLEENMALVLARDVLGQANVSRIILFMALWFILTYRWQEKPLFLKKTLMLLPLLYIAYFYYGYPMEYRVFFDLHAPLVLLATHTLIVGTGIAESPIFTSLSRRKPDDVCHA